MEFSDKGRCNSVALAKYIVAEANKKHISINITKVQKLLYAAYGVFLSVREERLTNEHPQAWPYGPVFPTTRNRLLKTDLYSIDGTDPDVQGIAQDELVSSLVEVVLKVYGKYSAGQLTAWSHANGSPWERATEQEGFKWGDTIPDEYIAPYFKRFSNGPKN